MTQIITVSLAHEEAAHIEKLKKKQINISQYVCSLIRADMKNTRKIK
jgi:hypothetical protein